ncbi:MAG: CCA tRNA nucleotidyltransferase [Deltaproteobacteria bacterium]|nr:CCA tRNA nucleotidyltransferase [Deltaproteobacteria bacterium]
MNIGDSLRRLPALPVLQDAGRCAGEMGFGAYAVGGLVRDLFLQRETLDVDIAIEGDSIAFASRFSADHGTHLLVYERFKTANLAFSSGFKMDVATTRTEVYEHPAALPLVRPGSIKDDLFRRDFSMNTLAVCLNPDRFGELLDPFQARKDIRKGSIRILHDRSFVDDPTRIFRAARFEKRFDFKLEDVTKRCVQDAVSAGLIERLSGYRIASELRLILKEEDPLPVIQRLEELGVIPPVTRKGRKHRGVRGLLRRMEEIKLAV